MSMTSSMVGWRRDWRGKPARAVGGDSVAAVPRTAFRCAVPVDRPMLIAATALVRFGQAERRRVGKLLRQRSARGPGRLRHLEQQVVPGDAVGGDVILALVE